MEGRQHSAFVLCACLIIVGFAAPASARSRGDAVTVGEAVEVFLTREEGTARAHGRRGSEECTALQPWYTTGYIEEAGQPPSPDHELWLVSCGGGAGQLVWLGPSNFTASPASLAEELRRRIEMPDTGVEVRPDSRGVTGIESYFWVSAYRGETVTESVSAFGMDVTVTAELAGVEWDFGDGTRKQSGGVGEPWPERSSVRHTYRDPSPDERPYQVTATVILQPRWKLNGADQGELEPIEVPFTRRYDVDEVQAVRRR